jgi:transcriptional regulator with XRE-family HTH domain
MSLKHSKDRTAWQKHCSEARNEPMRVFGELAARRHLTMRTVAKRAKADVSAFGRYFQSTQPTVTVLTKVAKALDIANPGRVARAFLRTLRVDELTDECYRIAERVSEAETLFGERSADAASAFWGWVNADAEARLDVCIASILADPFDLCESSPRKSVLGGYLGAVEDALGSHGSLLARLLRIQKLWLPIVSRRIAGLIYYAEPQTYQIVRREELRRLPSASIIHYQPGG